MAKVELVMPKMGESIIEATILKWVVPVGGTVEQDDPVLEIATDKVDSEVPAPVGGKVLEVFFKEGDVVPVGTVIAILETETAAASPTPSISGNGKAKVAEPKAEP
jgi:2-oxoglutarate dehydrogenase E2 component (dihydrolipoamide succinyltransferase)